MPPIGTLLAELWQVNPSFIIVYDRNTRKTCLMEGEFEVSSGDNIDSAIFRAWNKIFGKNERKTDD